MESQTAAIKKAWAQHAYYESAEQESWLRIFWGTDTIFRKRFASLDLQSCVELACGHGRHVQKYQNQAYRITLIDINESNIDFCRQRFADNDRISFLVNNGSNFHALPDSSFSAIFSYDAMVHFEMLDVIGYIRDAFRILRPGGRFLFHHSNNTAFPGLPWNKQPSARNFNSAAIVAHFAILYGFEVESQDIFSWGDHLHHIKDTDCLTMILKPLA